MKVQFPTYETCIQIYIFIWYANGCFIDSTSPVSFLLGLTGPSDIGHLNLFRLRGCSSAHPIVISLEGETQRCAGCDRPGKFLG